MADLTGIKSTGDSMTGTLGVVYGKDGKSAYEVALSNGFEGTEQEWLESLKGERGEQGVQGERGQQGVQGIQGVKGDTGAKGEKGDKGDTGNSGVYLGSGDMPADCNVQIDPNGSAIEGDFLLCSPQSLTPEQQAQARENIGATTIAEVIAALPVYNGEVVL